MKSNLKELRIKLDQMTERIISRLKDRLRYKLNNKVYQKNKILIKNRGGISFFEFALEGLEKYHASLGRYKFPDQFPIFSRYFFCQVKRKTPISSIAKVKINSGREIINFYLNSLKEFCIKGNDHLTYGETVYCDADIIELLNERINLGRYIAQVKLKKNPLLLKIKNFKKLETGLRNLSREKEVLEKAKNTALRYKFPQKIAEKYFYWIIRKTIEVEIEYLKKAAKQGEKYKKHG